jgi:hypothetical protein
VLWAVENALAEHTASIFRFSFENGGSIFFKNISINPQGYRVA